jgi:23S rRNA (guanosine2251-2'-O)-methyltransferase
LLEFQFAERSAIIVGSEGHGLRDLTRRECDYLVRIPLFGAIESLNVSQAASVMLFEMRRQWNGK